MSEPDYTPHFEDVIRMAIEQRLFDLNVSLPGIVQSYDAKTQRASIQPALQRVYGGVPVNLPVIQNVPVVFPRAASWQISGPVSAGDTGELRFAQRSLDIWKKQGGLVDPKNPRKFNLTDAIFYPGLVPVGKVTPNTTQNLVLQNGKATLVLTPGGMVEFTMAGGKSLVDTLISITAKLEHIADVLSKTTVNTMLGPMKLNDFSDFADTKSAITELKNDLTGLKG